MELRFLGGALEVGRNGMVLSEGSTEHGGYHEALIGLGSILGPGTAALTQWKWPNDLRAGVVVFLVALPLCLGIALASNAPFPAVVWVRTSAGLLSACSLRRLVRPGTMSILPPSDGIQNEWMTLSLLSRNCTGCPTGSRISLASRIARRAVVPEPDAALQQGFAHCKGVGLMTQKLPERLGVEPDQTLAELRAKCRSLRAAGVAVFHLFQQQIRLVKHLAS